MGRAMLIICAGLLVAMGYTFINVSERRNAMGAQNVKTFNQAMAQNAAHTGVQIALKKFSDDNSWRGPNTENFGDATVTFSIQEETGDVIRVNATSIYNNAQSSVMAFFDVTIDSPIPKFKGALSIFADGFSFDMTGNLEINGIDDEGDCKAEKAGLTVTTQDNADYVNEHITGNDDVIGAPPINVDNSVDFSKISDLISQLAEMEEVEYLNGRIRGNTDLGSDDNPGIFFVENPVTMAGNVEGYGIMVVRNTGDVDIEGSLDQFGNFEFHGLVIFENAYNYSSTGNSHIFGSVIVGQTEDYPGPDPSIDLTGNINFQYDCDAQKFANNAVKGLINGETVFKRLSIYE